MSQTNNYRYRLIARVVIEAQTPLAVGSGDKEIYTDATVARDVNRLPYIPGSSIAGVVRHALRDGGIKEEELNRFFGFQRADSGRGSEVIFSEAKMIGADGTAIDGLQSIDFNDDFYRHYNSLPVRQHVRISHRGAADDHGKFDGEIVPTGTRFRFGMEVVSLESGSDLFRRALAALGSAEFRIGGGSRKGFGKMSVISCQVKTFDLMKPGDLAAYLDHQSSLDSPFDGEEETPETATSATVYELTLKPVDFFLFGAGYGDSESDLVPVKGKRVEWGSGNATVAENLVLIPASSLKGALAHRVAYYYNKAKGNYAENVRNVGEEALTVNNPAVVALFGSADPNNKKRGNLLFGDIIASTATDKIFNHVCIDRFTGGTIDGALFQQKATYAPGAEYTTAITLTAAVDHDVQLALESALNDLCRGMLPLGGSVTKGHGCFTGSWQKIEPQTPSQPC